MNRLDWDSFYKNGYMVLHEPELFKYLELSLLKTKWVRIPFIKEGISYRVPLNKFSYRKPMKDTSNLIFERLFSDTTSYKKSIYSHVWNGTDSKSCEWHNDYIEGANVSILMYYSDVKENSGGELMMRRFPCKTITGIHRPSKYDVIVFSQEKVWQHRVEHFLDSRMERITVNFGFNIPELSYGFDN